jgi:hypothetical protein
MIASNTVYAQDVTLLNKGEPAPYKGLLFTESKANEIRKELLELDTLKLMEKSYEKSIKYYKDNEELYKHKVDTLLVQNDKLSAAYIQIRERSDWENRLWFGLGMVLTGLAVYSAAQLKK